MKLDMDIIRDLLLQVEGLKPYEQVLQIDTENLVEAEHIELLIESNLCYGNINKLTSGVPSGQINRLTWKGHQFLNTIRDEETWSKTKTSLSKLGAFTIELIQKVALDYITKQITYYINKTQANPNEQRKR